MGMIRAPRADEVERLRDIEWAAGTLFDDIGMGDIAADEPASVEDLAAYVAQGRAWVVTDDDDQPVGYAIVDIIDGRAHLEQLSVVPEHGRRGLGAALLEHVRQWAKEQHHDAVTLTTFTNVAWNAPFYTKHGYTVIADEDLEPGLRALRAREAEHGLDPAIRVCMRKST